MEISGEPVVRVLVVDDDEGIRRVIANTLRRMQYTPVIATEGREAMELANGEAFDLALIDLHMRTPGMEVARHLRARFGDAVWITIVTGEDDEATRAACLAGGADAVLAKPFLSADLRRVLAEGVAAVRPHRAA